MRTKSLLILSTMIVIALSSSILVCAVFVRAADIDATLTWKANAEPDLAGYKVYLRKNAEAYGVPVAVLGKVTEYRLKLPQLAVETTYFMTLTAYDAGGNESAKSAEEVNKVVAALPSKPGTPTISAQALSSTAITVSGLAVPDGAGGTAKIEVRYQISPMTSVSWATATAAPCQALPCVITDLAGNTSYSVQAVAYRGALNVDAVFGPLSAIVTATTPPVPDPPPAPPAGLQLTKHEPKEIVIIAKTKDCPRIQTLTSGSTATTLKRTIKCCAKRSDLCEAPF